MDMIIKFITIQDVAKAQKEDLKFVHLNPTQAIRAFHEGKELYELERIDPEGYRVKSHGIFVKVSDLLKIAK